MPSKLLLLSQALVTGLALSACGGSSSAASPDASTSDAETSDAAATSDTGSPADGGHVGDGNPSGDDDGPASGDDDAGGQIVEDGGSNIVLDGGDDGGGDTTPDGGACNAIVNAAPVVTSQCASLEPVLGGGQLVAGTYYLTGVTTYATAAFCKNTFIPVSVKETAQMTVTGEVGAVDSVSELATTAPRRVTTTLTPGANNASPLTEAPTCPATAASQTAKYEARTGAAGKSVLVLRLPYGKAEADYTLEKQ